MYPTTKEAQGASAVTSHYPVLRPSTVPSSGTTSTVPVFTRPVQLPSFHRNDSSHESHRFIGIRTNCTTDWDERSFGLRLVLSALKLLRFERGMPQQNNAKSANVVTIIDNDKTINEQKLWIICSSISTSVCKIYSDTIIIMSFRQSSGKRRRMMEKSLNSFDLGSSCDLANDSVPDLVHDSDSSSCSFSPIRSLRTRADSVASQDDELLLSTRAAPELDSCDNVFAKKENNEPYHRAKQVSWGTLNIKMYPIICGDHPDCVHGPPLTIAWDHVAEVTKSIDEVELKRGNKTSPVLRRNWLARRQLVRSLGATNEDIDEAQSESRRCRLKREATLSRLRFHDWREKVFRRLGRTFHVKTSPVSK